MKKVLLVFLLMIPLMVQAQEKKWWEGWMKISPFEIYTVGFDSTDVSKQTDWHVGKHALNISYSSYSMPLVERKDLPSDMLLSFSFCDPYHEDDWFESFDWLEEFDVISNLEKNSAAIFRIHEHDRGGEYRWILKCPCLDVNIDSLCILKGESYFKEYLNSTCAVGSEDKLYLNFKLNTGYPFNQDTLKAEETLTFKTYSVAKDGSLKLLAEKEQKFTLLDRDKPKIAGLYKYEFKPEIKGAGAYVVDVNSTWNNINRKYLVQVKDTLRADLSLDKPIYQKGVDKKAILKVKMDYDYPYVQKDEKDDKPTIRVRYDLLGVNDNGRFSYLKDSLLIADDTLATQHVNLERNIEIPLDEALANDTVTAEKDTLSLGVDIFFNGHTQLSTSLPMVIKNTPTGLKLVPAGAAEDGKAEFFNIQGQPLANPEAERGLVIKRRGGKALKVYNKK